MSEKISPVRCQTLPREVEAMRWMGQPQAGQAWEGASLEQLEAWGCVIAERPDNDGAIWIGSLGDEELIPVGYWIVKDPDEPEEFWPEPPEKFAMWFVPAGTASPEDEAVARQILLDYSDSLDEESFMLPLDATGLIQHIASALQRKGSAGEEAADLEIRRLQDGIRDHLISLGAPDGLIDGAGCDSGDPLDFTKAEITQAFNYFEDEHAAALRAEYQRGRDDQRREDAELARTKFDDKWDGFYQNAGTMISSDILARLGQGETANAG